MVGCFVGVLLFTSFVVPLVGDEPTIFRFWFCFAPGCCQGDRLEGARVQGALQLLINRYGQIRFAHVHERVSTKSFVVLIR